MFFKIINDLVDMPSSTYQYASQQQDEIQSLKEDAAVPYKIRYFQVQFFSRTT
jgi:formiminotetrahydrofolate cyclodeaminase